MDDARAFQMSFRPGRVLGGKYRIEEVIGEGGMGIVVAARHIAMNNRVAIKILVMDEEVEREDAIARFQREARAAARIESDHVVRVIDVAALADGTPYMVMDLLEGNDFRKLLHQRGQFPVPEAVGYILQACEGLSEAHAAGVVHRDLKPSNLFLADRSNGRKLVKVLDFGISKVVARPGDAAITTTNALMGSPVYMSPEQMRSSRTVDARADVWSLGLILYELLAGEVAFGGETIPEVCVAVMNNEPAPMSRYRSDVPEGLQRILTRCMAKDRDARYPTMAALARDLTRYADLGLHVHAERASAALKTPRHDRDQDITDPDAERAASLGEGTLRLDEVPVFKGDPETLKSWSAGRAWPPSSRRAAWVAVLALLTGIVATVGVLRMRRPAPEPPTALTSPVAPAPTSADPVHASPPVARAEIPSVPIDSLPLVTHDAGVARPWRAPAPLPTTAAPPASATVTVTPIAPPSSAPPAPSKKDDWKWGDRN